MHTLMLLTRGCGLLECDLLEGEGALLEGVIIIVVFCSSSGSLVVS